MTECACASLIFTFFFDVPFWFMWILSLWIGLHFHSSMCCLMALACCCWREFCFCLSWLLCRNQQLFSPVFQWVVGTSFSLPPSSSTLSANRKLHSGRPPMDTDDSGMSVSSASSAAWSAKLSFSDGCWVVKAFCIIFSRNMLNSTGDNDHPCHTPVVVRKKSPTFPFSNTALVAS